ncbi:TonB-dependent receptor [Solitalea canadensis]|uniref:Outer membrane receptor protein n=1 Tax=Solitalea canadensis (strain ATCC 29591 / DSM 3403 / JCM 21819 / LMG 8368 / NBRC 15130 / NCIMB 12057 / USAM 9D) TaxID=929556 RepID=H8KPD2_SOLCM|nr:TonB-dependent receptor [Solitalea canadensis]AFD05830.1 outer membrane receptor protein [Solitalea canadensis DSM 3403]
MFKPITIALILSFLGLQLFAQTKSSVSGVVIDEENGMIISNVSITIGAIKLTSGNKGEFKTTLISNHKHQFTANHLAYQPLQFTLTVTNDTSIVVRLKKLVIETKEVEVHANTTGNAVSQVQTGVIEMSKKELKKLPTFLGEADPMRTLKLMPGIGNGGEANSGLYVRGGSSGQNLILYNDAQIYNPSHLLGFFSVFNSDGFDNISLMKSGVSAQYGGSLSSVLKVNTFKSVPEKTTISGTVGLIYGKVAAAIPFSSSTYLNVAVRQTFLNLTVWPVYNQLGSGQKLLKNPKYDFHDLNLNFVSKLSGKDLLSFTAYSGRDDFGLGLTNINMQNSMYWGNDAAALSWSHQFNDKTNLNQLIGYSNYQLDFSASQDAYSGKFTSGITDLYYKNLLRYTLNRHQLSAGIQYTYHNLLPNKPEIISGDTKFETGPVNRYYTHEAAVFIEDDFELSDKLSINGGLRFTNYRHLGPYSLVQSVGNNQTDTTLFASNKLIKQFNVVEPRFTLRYLLNDQSSVKLSFEKRNQFIHLLTVSAVNFPSDFWVSSSKNIPNQTGYQYSGGYYRNLFHNNYEGAVELYYRSMAGQVELNQSLFNLIDNSNFDTNLLFGSGRSMGAEFQIRKKKGKISGWLSYTLSKTDRQFDGINNGERFAAKYDRRHDASLVAIYNINKKWDLSASFTYNTGNAFTLPIARYIIDGNIVNEYGPYNSFRMPDYHRLDISAKYQLKSSKRFQSSLDFSIYNAYNQDNPMYVFFIAKGDLEKYKVQITKQPVSLLRMLPSVAWNFKF